MGFLRRPQNLKKSSLYFWQERRVLCTQQRTCQIVDEDFSKQMWSQVVLYKLYKSNFWRVSDIRSNCVQGIVGGLWYWCLKVRVDLGVNLCTMMAFDIFFLKEFWPYNGSKRAQSEPRSYRKCLNNGGSHLKSTVFFQHQQEWDALLR